MTRCLVLLLALAFMGQGRVGQGFQLLLFADQRACCQAKQHCPISYGKKTLTHSSHSPDCPHAHQRSRASFRLCLASLPSVRAGWTGVSPVSSIRVDAARRTARFLSVSNVSILHRRSAMPSRLSRPTRPPHVLHSSCNRPSRCLIRQRVSKDRPSSVARALPRERDEVLDDSRPAN